MKNREHLRVLRANTCYPSFRAFIGFLIVLGYFMALIGALAGIAGIFRENAFLIGSGFVGCAFTIFMTKAEKDDVRISTVFLGIDHQYENGESLLFETMVFGGEHDQDMDRYSSIDDAEKGHDEMVEKVFGA